MRSKSSSLRARSFIKRAAKKRDEKTPPPRTANGFKDVEAIEAARRRLLDEGYRKSFRQRVAEYYNGARLGNYTELEKASIEQMLFAEQYEIANTKLPWQAVEEVEVEPEAPKQRRVLETTSALRKEYPITTGMLDYFPDACAEVSRVSYLGNQKHNPGEPMHHARGKSMDHADCIARHLTERGGFDGDIRHSAALAWRALALLQEELENEKGLPLPRAARA